VSSIIDPLMPPELSLLSKLHCDDVAAMNSSTHGQQPQDTIAGDRKKSAMSRKRPLPSDCHSPVVWPPQEDESIDSDSGDTTEVEDDDDPDFWTCSQQLYSNRSAWNVLSNISSRVGESLEPVESHGNNYLLDIDEQSEPSEVGWNVVRRIGAE
jgi:hypothetical protein